MPKTSDLPTATTPLDGTEIFPVVQSGSTKKAGTSSLVLGDGGITNIVACTQATYDGLSPDATTLYVIVP